MYFPPQTNQYLDYCIYCYNDWKHRAAKNFLFAGMFIRDLRARSGTFIYKSPEKPLFLRITRVSPSGGIMRFLIDIGVSGDMLSRPVFGLSFGVKKIEKYIRILHGAGIYKDNGS